MSKKYITRSPDNFPLSANDPVYRSVKQAKQAIAEFANNYKAQGYYSQTCYNGYIRRISVQELPDYCDIIAI